jgi:hypothetical protein
LMMVDDGYFLLPLILEAKVSDWFQPLELCRCDGKFGGENWRNIG